MRERGVGERKERMYNIGTMYQVFRTQMLIFSYLYRVIYY